MHFKKLELVGFKSFSDKTTLHFEPGVTAIVGPNGCGKSNIFDSIRWVLGEQSAKSLRGSDMQDVIFNGTDLKEPLGMAEVTLTFDNENKFFNFEHPEIAITRRIFRSGESEYLLNKTQVRLKDILDILLGTGVGAESYSIVAQGKIDLVLSSRPEDRRMVFDEASGITKYKSQKRETARKLEETEQNLLRINDIITEVKRQIGSLERQANKARRYKEAFEELKSKELNLAIAEKEQLKKEKEGLIARLKELEASESGLIDLLKEQEEKIANHQQELRVFENSIMDARNEVLNLENTIVRNKGQINFNREKIAELIESKRYFEEQAASVRNKLAQEEEKLNCVREEYSGLKKNIEEKGSLLAEKETQINIHAVSIKSSLENISRAKQSILDIVARIAATKNEAADFISKEQIFQARRKRLEIEKAKVFEEKAITEENLKNITDEVDNLRKIVEELNGNIALVRQNLEQEGLNLSVLNTSIADLEKEKLSLVSHKEFLEELKAKYNDIGEAMNAVIFLDKAPAENVSGLVIKVKEQALFSETDKPQNPYQGCKFLGEAKPIELDTQKIDEKIIKLEENIAFLSDQKGQKEADIQQLHKNISGLQQALRAQEIAFANKDTSRMTILEQFNKIKEEEDLIVLELQDLAREIEVLKQNILVSENKLAGLNKEHREKEDVIRKEEDTISTSAKAREELLVAITQVKTELESLNKRIVTDEATLKMVEDTYNQDKEALNNLEKQALESSKKKDSLEQEVKECEGTILVTQKEIESKNISLSEIQSKYKEFSLSANTIISRIEEDRKSLDMIKNDLYQLQMEAKDIDYKYSTIKERMLSAYKIDIEAALGSLEAPDINALSQEIKALKNKLDSYGTVNLVAIEEYDELKKRYDFLIQQQADLVSAKDSLHEAILKINRTTKQMFLETFDKVREEFRSYFKLLFNGGDAQLFLTDENDPLESGIEIICRPPGKKLQNVLLLSGGEKSMSAIALIFAIFKVKPSPFCVLDEIDAALDEANVDRFGRMLQEFAKQSQFIVVTHNKRTIANADVMYGITMQESGVSKIVSVKFSKESAKNKEPIVPAPISAEN